jgi:opacity protein-like surface antigen
MIAVAVAFLATAGTVDAQYREGRWELGLGVLYQLGADFDSDGGSTLETDDDLGFVLDVGYNLSDTLAVSFVGEYAGVGYDATVIDDEGEIIGISGDFDQWVVGANLVYHFSEGPLTPYVGAGIGYTWIDTNIPTGPPVGGCWWDPWWGWVCYSSYPTKTESAFSYQAFLGLRYELNDPTFMKLSYTSQWMDFSNATSTPRFDVIGLEIGWMF